MSLQTISRLSKLILPGLCTVVTSCATRTKGDQSTYYEAAFDDRNRAPAVLVPSPALTGENKTQWNLDPAYVRTQADYHFAVGEAQSYEGNHQGAVESFKMVLIYDRDAAPVHLRLSVEYLRLGLSGRALEEAQIATQKDPKLIEARLLLAGLLSSMRVYDKALAQYDIILKQDPENAESLLYTGAILSEQKQYNKAVKYFESLGKNEGYSTPHLAYYYIGKVRSNQEGPQYQKLAEIAYKKSLALKPDYVDSLLALGELYSKMNKISSTIKLYSVFQKERGPNVRVAESLASLYLESEQYDLAYEQLAIIEQSTADSLNIKVRMALILIEQKKYNQAISKLNEILVLAPDSDKILFYLAAVYEEIKQTNKAIHNFKKIPPESQYFFESVVHGVYLMKQDKDIAGALQWSKKAMESREDIPQLIAVYSSLLDESRKYEEALLVLTRGVDKFPEQVQLRFFLGAINDRLGRKDAMISNMKRVIEMDPNHVQGLNYLAYTYSEINSTLDEAERLVQRALAIEPKDAFIMDTYGWVLLKQGRTKESIRVLEGAHKSLPKEAIIADHLGDAYFKAQMMDRAEVMYKRAFELETNGRKAEEIRLKMTSTKNQQWKSRTPASSMSGD